MHSLPFRARLPYLHRSCTVQMAFAWGMFTLHEDLHYPGDACTVSLAVLKKWIENGNFNPENMAEADYGRSTAIMVALYPDVLLNDIEGMGIGMIVRWCRVHCLDRYLPFLGQLNMSAD